MSSLNYKASYTGGLFHASNAFVRGIMGPVGSGKSVTCCIEIFQRAKHQTPSRDGIRRSRWLVVRNTQPMLETTTIKTWLDWFPESVFGTMNRKPPFTHRIEIGDIYLEVIFLALDKPQDVKKLLSLECTGIWFNEARDIDYDLLSMATSRVGRYPSKKDKPDETDDKDWPAWHGIILDTNPPDDQHWWHKMAELDGWSIDRNGDSVNPKTIPEHLSWKFWRQPSGLSPDAENIENLAGGYDYYKQMLGGKDQEWINIYVHGNYGYVKEGLPVYKNSFSSETHVATKEIPIKPAGLIYCGIDASGRKPASIFLQRTPSGQIQAIEEFCVTDEEGMGAVSYAKALKMFIRERFPRHDIEMWGDPAGGWKSQNDEQTYYEILRGQGLFCKPSPALRIPERIEAVVNMLERMIEGKPALLISPKCKMLVRGFQGGYRYRKMNVSGGKTYDNKPDKTTGYADIHDALQYGLSGMGASNILFNRKQQSTKTSVARTSFSI